MVDVTSPTFAVVHELEGERLRLLHVDLYRLEASDSLGLGLEDELDDGRTVAAIEWPERGVPAGDALLVVIEQEGGADERSLQLHLAGPSWEARRGRLLVALDGVGLGAVRTAQ